MIIDGKIDRLLYFYLFKLNFFYETLNYDLYLTMRIATKDGLSSIGYGQNRNLTLLSVNPEGFHDGFVFTDADDIV